MMWIAGGSMAPASTAWAEETSSSSVSSMDSAFSSLPDRRKEQFQTSYGYALFPFPYSLPGIGEGVSLVGGAMKSAALLT